MAFADTLLHHTNNDDKTSSSSSECVRPSVVMLDKHPGPGGQWNDSYDFVRLHQPSNMYGVESTKLEPDDDNANNNADTEGEAHRAKRSEILDYYQRVRQNLEHKFDFHFLGDTTFNMDLIENGNTDDGTAPDVEYKLDEKRSIRAKKVVDARYLEPDLPVHVGPKFTFNSDKINCIPVNSLPTSTSFATIDKGTSTTSEVKQNYVIIGAGKTGMDAIVYLLEQGRVDPDDIMWIVPHEAWITARENIGSCMELLHTCTKETQKSSSGGASKSSSVTSKEFFQNGFLKWEMQGKVYRFDKDILPTKFKDATLSKSELALLQQVKRVVRNGRVKSIEDDGTLTFADGTTLDLPWSSSSTKDTTFIHCSAGAFNYSKQTQKPPPIFGPNRISVQDVYGTPGFCFVGSVIGRLETITNLSDEEKNAMCLCPIPDASQAKLPLGPSGGDIGIISSDHGLVQRLSNLRTWMTQKEMREWIVKNRLFNLRHCSAEEIDTMVQDMWTFLEDSNVVSRE